MINYRRNKTGNPDDVFFLTLVTSNRTPWIKHHDAYKFLHDKMKHIHDKYDTGFVAWAILPDHIHWLLRSGNRDYSDIVGIFKRGVGAEFKDRGFIRHGEKLWQDRFWEETIRDDKHYWNCVDYIHYNPVKHGLVRSLRDWKWSSFGKYVSKGFYEPDWSKGCDIEIFGAEWD